MLGLTYDILERILHLTIDKCACLEESASDEGFTSNAELFNAVIGTVKEGLGEGQLVATDILIQFI